MYTGITLITTLINENQGNNTVQNTGPCQIVRSSPRALKRRRIGLRDLRARSYATEPPKEIRVA